jgi:Arc/MetJ-type ribon-helix-helix transcriptional regulator
MSRITITVDKRVLAEIDRLVRDGSFATRSQAIDVAVKEWLRHSRLAREAAKLDVAEEQALAEEGYANAPSS